LAYRETDRVTRFVTGLVPLSVATDRIGLAAMRCAGLLARLAAAGCPVDRAGAGVVVEVYPAASLKQWQLTYRGYKGRANAIVRDHLVDRLITAAPWLKLGEHQQTCRESDHALDAVIAALTARAAALAQASTPTPEHADAARTEGWIALPTRTLTDLPPPPNPRRRTTPATGHVLRTLVHPMNSTVKEQGAWWPAHSAACADDPAW
jgi:hypothetical protein